MNQKEYIRLIQNHGQNLLARKDEFEIPSISSVRGDVGLRVHNRGEDDQGNTRKYKSKAYVKRFKKVDPVRMVKDGDLRNDFDIYKNGKDNVLGFRDDLSIKKILGEENRRTGKLYSLTDEEVDGYYKSIDRFSERIQKQLLDV